MTVAVLFARRDSVYKSMMGVDVWDADRDATNYRGQGVLIAHPPCRGWGRLKAFAKATPEEMDLGRLAVRLVRENGGIVEHPAGSSLWPDQGMTRPTEGPDAYGGFTVLVDQCHFGHRAQKATWLYIVGIPQSELIRPMVTLGFPDRTVTQLGRAAREHTPEPLARWLVELARWIEARSVHLAALGIAPARMATAGQVDRGTKEPAGAGQLELF